MAQSFIPPTLPPELRPIAAEADRLHESVLWSAQIQFEQMKLWRSLNLILGVPAAVLAAVAGGTGLAADTVTSSPAILALVSAGFGAALTTLNPSRRMSQAQAAASAYLEMQTSARQFLSIRLPQGTREEALEELANLTARRDEVNRTADAPGRYAYRRAKKNIGAGSQTYQADASRET
jgi:hypothetical protein